ncbi:MAG: DNA alkylation repair protein [Bacteroides sp.]|nr:DNA alkylation repair protein [Bacteroides sp.]
MNKIYLEIKQAFEESSNKDIALNMSKYMKNKFMHYGIQTPLRRSKCKHIISSERKKKGIDYELLDLCWADGHREFQYFALDYLTAKQSQLTYDDIPHLFKYVKTKQWWDTIDFLDRIIGNIGLTDSRVDNLMLQWSVDEDFWVRRIAIDHQLLRKEKTNVNLLEKILINNLGSNEFFINKAIGWSLRDYSKTNPEWVRKFIETHKDKMSSLSIREGGKYL